MCNGAQVLAAAGLLDGRTATAHWSTLGALASTTRRCTGSKGIASSRTDASPRPQASPRVSPERCRSWPIWPVPTRPPASARSSDTRTGPSHGDTTIPTQSFALTDLPVGLNALIPWGRPTLGIALTDGIGEIDVASTFEVYAVSYAARAVPISSSGAITTKHGMVLLTNTPRTLRR